MKSLAGIVAVLMGMCLVWGCDLVSTSGTGSTNTGTDGTEMGGTSQVETFGGIRSAEPAGDAVPEIGIPVSVEITNAAEMAADVTVRFFVSDVEVHRFVQRSVPGMPLDTLGPDLTTKVTIDVMLINGVALDTQVFEAGLDFDEGDVIAYTFVNPDDQCPDDPSKLTPGACGCGVADTDTDGDGTADCIDQCPDDPYKTEPGIRGCGQVDPVAPVIVQCTASGGLTELVAGSLDLSCTVTDADGVVASVVADFSPLGGDSNAVLTASSGSADVWELTAAVLPPTGGTIPVTVTATDDESLSSTAQVDVEVQRELGTLSGSVKDASTGDPLAAATVQLFDGSNVVAETTTDSAGAFELDAEAAAGYTLEASQSGYLPEEYFNVEVTGGEVTFLAPIALVPGGGTLPGVVSGTIVNALTGSPVDGLTVELRRGIQATSGTVIDTVTTDSSAMYLATLDAGIYTAVVSGDGFVDAVLTVVSIAGELVDNQNGSVTPVLPAGQWRVVLSWGASPGDLDSHLTGPASDGSRFHVYYANKSYEENGVTVAGLDLDDVSSYGPETITLYVVGDGTYRYSVHDYSNRYATTTQALSNSGAAVQVYNGATLAATFNIPTGVEGTLWTVFEIVDGVLTPVNVLSYDSPSQAARGAVETDAALMRKLPAKR